MGDYDQTRRKSVISTDGQQIALPRVPEVPRYTPWGHTLQTHETVDPENNDYASISETEPMYLTFDSTGTPAPIGWKAGGEPDFQNKKVLSITVNEDQHVYFLRHFQELHKVASDLQYPEQFVMSFHEDRMDKCIKVVHHEADTVKAMPAVMEQIQKVSRKIYDVCSRDITCYLKSQTGQQDMRQVEEKSLVVIQLQDRSSQVYSDYLSPVASPVYRNTPSIRAESMFAPTTLDSDYERKDRMLTTEDVEIKLVQGELQNYKADVLVNAVGICGGLDGSAVSEKLVEKGGQQLKKDYLKEAKKDSTNHFIITKAYKLSARKIYHIVCLVYNTANASIAEKDMRSKIQTILVKAHEKKYKCLAMPAIGTGNLGYPARLMAQIILEEVVKFSQKYYTTNLTRIVIVLYPRDRTIIEDFELVLGAISTGRGLQELLTSVVCGGGATAAVPEVTFPLRLPVTANTTLVFKQGSVTEEKVEGIINPTSENLKLTVGVLPRLIVQAAGPGIQVELTRQKPNGLAYGEMVSTSGGNAKWKKIYHTAVPPWNQDRRGTAGQACRRCLEVCVTGAMKDNIVSLAIPAFGTGGLGYPEDVVAKVIINFLMEFCSNNPQSSLRYISVVIYTTEALKAFRDQLTQVLTPSQIDSACGQGSGKGQLQIVGTSEEHKDKAHQDLLALHQVRRTTKLMEGDRIRKVIPGMGEEKRTSLEEIEAQCNVVLHVNDQPGRESIMIEGFDAASIEEAANQVTRSLGRISIDDGRTISFEPPDSWDPMEEGRNVKIVALDPTSQEFRSVQNDVNRSMKKKQLDIAHIQRIQNKSLTVQYLSEKTRMKASDQDQLELYHGTHPDNVDSICNHGFNRRFFGKNGKKYGQGSYFARGAEYAAGKKYSAPDDEGYCYLFQCDVLVGRSVQGDERMDMPPLIDAKIDSETRYDSTVDSTTSPNVFVIYHDTQAYPKYKIAFR